MKIFYKEQKKVNYNKDIASTTIWFRNLLWTLYDEKKLPIVVEVRIKK